MSKYEKFMNILMKIMGVTFVIDAIGIWLGFYTPKNWAVGFVYILVAIVLLFGRFSKKQTKI